jgi:ParB-like chromosome segregation protein Spo0J
LATKGIKILAEDIRKRGLRSPIVYDIYDGTIFVIDGYRRLKALEYLINKFDLDLEIIVIERKI